MSNKSRTAERVVRVRTLIEPVVAREGYELIDVQFVSDRGQMIMRLYIDTIPPSTETAGVNVDDCSHVSRIVGDILDVEDVVDGKYRLEVSSPGIFRPLTKPEHYDRAVGERVKVKTFAKLHDRRVFTGVLEAHAEGQLKVNVDGTAFALNVSDVAKANLEPVLDF